MSFEEVLKIPEERISKALKVVKELAEYGINIRAENNDIIITGEGVEALKAKNVVIAIGRGFKPADALLLMNDDYSLEVVEVKEYARSRKSMTRLKGRVIGESGRAKRFIETHTGCVVCVQGKTVSIIGKNDELVRARRAVMLLLEGSKHGTAYQFLEKRVD